MVDQIYEDFTNTVSNQRKIEKTTLINEIGAIVFNANIAKNNYLIDGVINLDSLIKAIARNNEFDDLVKEQNKDLSEEELQEIADKLVISLFGVSKDEQN